MKGLNHFIIELKVDYSDTFKTESGFELYMNKDISFEKLSNRIAKVINTPVYHETEIEPGDMVMIDPSILYQQIYRGQKQESIYLVDKEKGWYRIEPKEIILHKKNESDQWKGYLQNNLVEPILEVKEEITSSLIIMLPEKQEFKKGRAKAFLMNENIEVNKGDELVLKSEGGVPFWIEGKELWWVRNRDVLAVIK